MSQVEEARVFVARQAELARFDGFLDSAMAGQAQICFIAGEAGTGKSTLVDECSRRAQEKHGDLVVATGTCDAQTGAADPYLPFREVLSLLVGGFDSKPAQGKLSSENARRLKKLFVVSVEALIELAPDLIGLFVPGAKLLGEVGKTLADKSDLTKRLEKRLEKPSTQGLLGSANLDQDQIHEQFTNLLRGLAEHQPLMVVLDDLHWADASSIGLLFRLGRRLESSRVLVIGTYRPETVALGRDGERHPLVPVLSEIKRYRGDVAVDLDQARIDRGREFVNAYLDSQLNCLDAEFREALYEHTNGQPLFTVELLRSMRERGDLIQDEEGCWAASTSLDWTDLPSRVEGVIEERIGRLPADLRQALTVASVEGEQFIAEVVAEVESLDVRDLVRQLSRDLQREHHLVESQGVQRLGRQRLSLYRFAHNLMQTYLYTSLDEVELSYLHEDVGTVLESLYGESADEIAVQLARHFELAEMPDKARYYLQRAGVQAAARFANSRAIDYFSRALDLAPADAWEDRHELLLAREHVYSLQGAREDQLSDLRALDETASQLDDVRRQAEVMLRRAAYALQTGTYAEAAGLAEQSAALAVRASDRLAEARAHHRWGRALWQAADYGQAQPHIETALALSRSQGSTYVEAQCLYDLGVLYYFTDQHRAALQSAQQALDLFRSLDERRGQSVCLSLVGIVFDSMGRYSEAMDKYAEALKLSREVGWRYAESSYLQQCGDNRLQLGDLEAARELLEQAVTLCKEIGDREAEASSLDVLGTVFYNAGQPGMAVEVLSEALAIYREIGDARGEGYARTHLGYAYVELEQWRAAAAELETALKIRREIRSEALVVDTLAGMALVAQGQGEPERAQANVAEALAWLAANSPDGVESPVQVYLVCYQILRARARQALTGDRAGYMTAAESALESGYALLAERASRIPDQKLRERFMTNLPANRMLHAAWLDWKGSISEMDVAPQAL